MADPYTTPIPGATGYESATLAAKTAYQNALARLNQQRGDTLRQYGYAGDIDPTTGTISNIRVDANLPYGMYQQARQSHADQYAAERQSALDRGISGGLARHGMSRLRYGFGADDAQIGQGLSGAVSAFQDQQNQAAYTRDQALAEAQLQAARDAIAREQFNPADVSDVQVDEGPDWGSLITDLIRGGSDDTVSNDSAPANHNGPSAPAAKPAVSQAVKNNAAYVKAAAQYQAKQKAAKKPVAYVHSPGVTPAKPVAKPAAPKAAAPKPAAKPPAPKPAAPKPAAPKPTPKPAAPAKKTTKKGK